MNLPKETAELLEAYYAGDPSPEVIEAMEAWLREDKANPRLLAEYGLIDRLIAHEQKNQDASAIFAALLEAEDNAEPDFSLLRVPASEMNPIDPGERSVTFHDLCSVAGYLAIKGIRTKAARYGSIAAVLVLGAVLYLSIFGLGSTPDTQRVADDTPTTPEQREARVVATLTDQHDAQWQAEPGWTLPGVGDVLRVGQRLTLQEGYATFTTARGASSLLAAPCSIELIDDNHIKLIRGRLVGTCPTPLSKGLKIDTPEGQIVDVGTQFGVYVDRVGRVGVRVFEGTVEVATRTQPQDKHTLFAGDLARIENGRFERVAYGRSFDFPRSIDEQRVTPPTLTGPIKWLAYTPAVATKFEQADHAYLFFEKSGVPVPAGTEVNFGDPRYVTPKTRFKGEITRDTTVDSYFFFFHPPDEDGLGVVGEITFDRPIIAVISNDKLLAASDPLFAVDGTNYDAPFNRGLEADILQISPDGRTLSFTINAIYTDQFRVLIAPEEKGGDLPNN